MSGQSDKGCPWGISSSVHGYCFWTYIQASSDPDGRMDPVPDSETCTMLGITQGALDKTILSAIAKLKSVKNTEELKDFRQAVLDRAAVAPDDNTIYMPNNFRMPIEEKKEDEELPEDLIEIKKPRRDKSMPLHRDGKKTDIYGLGRRKK